MEAQDHSLTDVIVFQVELEAKSDIVIGNQRQANTNIDESAEKDVLQIVKLPDGSAYIPGSSLAGVLQRMYQHNQEEIKSDNISYQQFWANGSTQYQSHIIIDPILPLGEIATEKKEGIRINKKTRIVDPGALYGFERIQAGAKFSWTIEIKRRECFDSNNFMRLSYFLVTCLENGLKVGAKTNSGYGILKCKDISTAHFEASKHFEQWMSFLKCGNIPHDLKFQLDPSLKPIKFDPQPVIHMSCKAWLSSGMITGEKLSSNYKNTPDSRSKKRNDKAYWLDNEAIKGPISHRCYRILNTIDNDKLTERFNDLFGFVLTDSEIQSQGEEEPVAKKGRFRLFNSKFNQDAIEEHIQKNIKIDRFTNATYGTALRTTQYIVRKGSDHNLSFHIEIIEPTREDIMLVVQSLKDMANNDLCIGGKSSIGYGGLMAIKCVVTGTSFDSEITLDFGSDRNTEKEAQKDFMDILKSFK